MRPVRIVLVEDNEVFRDALELLLGMRDDVEIVASVGDGAAAVTAAIEHHPDVVLMDYRLPALDGIQATAQVVSAVPDVAVVALTASADDAERDALLDAGAVACLARTRNSTRSSARSCRPPQWRDAHRREHGDRPRLDRRPARRGRALPELARRAAVRQLRRREPARRRRNNCGGLLRKAARGERLPHDVAADARRLPRLLPRARRVRADPLAACLGRVPGTFASAETAAAELADGRVHAIDTETASASIAMLALAIQRRLERGTSDEEVGALVERYRRERGLLFTVDTLEFLQRGGRIGKAAAFAGTLLHVKPILSIRDGEVEPIKRCAESGRRSPSSRRARDGDPGRA